jgi:hypothetical protein
MATTPSAPAETDSLGRRTEHIFDPAGREIGTADRGPSGTLLAQEWHDFDADGHQTAIRTARSSGAEETGTKPLTLRKRRVRAQAALADAAA